MQELIHSEEQRAQNLKRISNLYRDKISLRSHVEDQSEAIDKLTQTIINLYARLSQEINMLKNYNNLLPSQKELALQK